MGAVVHAENPRLDSQSFRPSPHAGDLFATITNGRGLPWSWNADLWLSYGSGPLVFVDAAGVSPDHEVIADQVTLHATGALAFSDWLSVGLEVPVFLLNDGDDSGFVPLAPVPSQALGDVRLSAKVGIVTRARGEDGLGLGLELPLAVPTGDGDAFVSDGWSFAPTLAIDLRAGGLLLAGNIGVRLRASEGLVLGTDLGSELLFRVAASYDLLPDRLTLLGEIQGASHDFDNANNTYVEALIGGRLQLGDDGLQLTAAGGRGLASGYGSTSAKLVLALGWAPPAPRPAIDSDGDGLLDDVDRCPRAPEDRDDFEDGDGCPEDDNDQDGVLDIADRCPVTPEDKDDFQDEDGCPDLDDDQDGVADLRDGIDGSCRSLPEDKDGFQDDDGCPDPDNDGDGILDAEDDCPLDGDNRCGIKVDDCEIAISERVYFDLDRATIKPESFAILDAVATLLAARDTIKQVEVQGHTDDMGPDGYNLELSQRRAEAVVSYLVGKGVARQRLSGKGYGEASPIANNGTNGGRAKNRRVQFIIIDPAAPTLGGKCGN